LNKDIVCLSSQTIDIAENESYLELTNRVCFYDEPNLNNAMLPSEGAKEKAETLINMPVVARYRVNSKGEPTLGGHEMYIDEDGEVAFATDSIGTHTEVYIQDDNVDVDGTQRTLPCLFAKYRIWKRNKNIVAAIRRLFAENKLFSSWEIATSAYEFKDGIKKITDYVFLSNCLLGYEFSSPAYGKDAKAVSLSTKESQLLIAEALSHDILDGLNINATEKEDVDLKKNKETEVSEEAINTDENLDSTVKTTENSEVSSEGTEAPTKSVEENAENVETSALTDRDLRMKLMDACEKKLDTYGWIAFHFPLEKTVWFEDWNRESELDYVLFTYEVENEEIVLSEPQNVKLTVSVSEINSQIESKNDAIVKASEEIQVLKIQISELTPFKEKFEQVEQKRIEKETSEKKQNLISKYEKSGLITKEEFESSQEIKGFVDALDEKALKELVATRYMASLEKEEVEISETKETKKDTNVASASLVDDDVTVDKVSVMKKFLGK
jgi:hypothetical protein